MNKLFHYQEEHYRSIQQQTHQMAIDFEQSIGEDRNWRQTEEEIRCLQALCTSTYIDHKALNFDRVHGTCQWFLNNAKFHDWAESDCSELLWVTADPGCGKSVLSKSLIDCELRSTLSLTTAYFFFKDDIPEQRSVTHALCALLHQLCSQNRALLRKAVEAYCKNGMQLTSSFAWLWELLIRVAQIPDAGEIVCIVDALDECQENDRKTLIGSLNHFYACRKDCEVQLKFLVTSRPYYDIEESFDHNTIRLTGEDENETIKHEINLLIRDRVPKIASRKRLDRRTQAALQKCLLQVENRTYLWLHLTLDSVEKTFGLATPQKMGVFIRQLPRTINQAYEAMLFRCPQPEQARKMLHIILASRRPLSLREMNMAYNIETGQKSREEVDLLPEESFGSYVKNLCGLLVRIHGSKIFLLHQTVKEFLLRENLNTNATRSIDLGEVWKGSMEPRKSNLVLAKSCLYCLSFTVFDEITNIFCCGQAPHHHSCSTLHCPPGHRYADSHYEFFDYAALNWVDHFRLAGTERELNETWSYLCCDVTTNRFFNWFDMWRAHALLDFKSDSMFTGPLWRSELSPLNLALMFGHDAITRQLLEKDDEVDSRNLILAARSGNVDVLRILLEASVSIEAKSSDDYTPLMEAAWAGQHLAVKELLKAGAQMAATNHVGETALMIATRMGHSRVVEVLLEANDQK